MSSDEVEPWTPAFPGQRPPFAKGNELGFAKGNELTLKHGVYSERKVAPIAAQLTADLLSADGHEYLREGRWRMAVSAWARAEARVLLLTAWLEDNGGLGLDHEGNIAPAMNALKDWESRAEKSRSRLGLDPLSAARLGKDRTGAALDAATIMARLEAADRKRQQKGGTDE